MHPQYTSSNVEYNPPPSEQISWLLEDMERFIQTKSEMDILIKAAMAYYQFETIPPFLPMSAILLREQDECFSQFIGMQHFGEFSEWIRFFVNGIAISAENALEQIKLANMLRKIGIENIRSYK